MGRLNYSFNDRYLVSLSGRFDGSSRLAPGNKWAFFPSIGLGWQLGEEPFLQDLDLFTNLKLRASYGRTGNTGRSYGAHTHFEILLNGTTPVDPIVWLRAHVGG